MSKLDELRRTTAGNVDESMGGGRPARPEIHGVSGAGPRAVPSRLQGITRSGNAAEIPVEKIGRDDDQPREDFDPEALDRLAESLKTRGQLQPIRVRWSEERGQYVIICGERRWRAAMQAGLATMSCVIVDGPLDPGDLLAIQVIENALREDLQPIEQARAFRALMDRNGWSARQVARELGIVQPNVVRALALLDLPAAVQERVESGQLAPSVAYEVSRLDDPDTQAEVAARVVAEGLSRAETVEAVKRAASKPRAGGAKGRGAAKAKAKKVTERVIRTEAGPRVIVEFKRGLDGPAVLAALDEARAKVAAELAELGGDREAA
jgi:ParB family chromosome partitioning protein